MHNNIKFVYRPIILKLGFLPFILTIISVIGIIILTIILTHKELRKRDKR